MCLNQDQYVIGIPAITGNLTCRITENSSLFVQCLKYTMKAGLESVTELDGLDMDVGLVVHDCEI